ncbi:hypothetical protein F4780DRAFT_780181 [Xylariomycetidae sp. FL0641]|nr:hypothetical protein F4780DRAFT_780181 [Xylariomycetidae sp. FL0641]
MASAGGTGSSWDDILLRDVDFRKTDWRTYAQLHRIPWARLARGTVDEVARRMGYWDSQNQATLPPEQVRVNPASLEQLRRLSLASSSPSTGAAMDVDPASSSSSAGPEEEEILYQPVSDDRETRAFFQRSRGDAPPASDDPFAENPFDYGVPPLQPADAPEGYYTIGIKMQLCIAGVWRPPPGAPRGPGGPAGQTAKRSTHLNVADNPHPEDLRWYGGELYNVRERDWRFWETVMMQVNGLLNGRAGVVAVPRTPASMSLRTEVEERRLEALAVGEFAPFVMTELESDTSTSQEGSPHTTPSKRPAPRKITNPAVVEIAIEFAHDRFLEWVKVRMPTRLYHQVEEANIRDFVEGMLKMEVFDDETEDDIAEIKERVTDVCKMLVLRETRDPEAADLPGMKARYRTWNVTRTWQPPVTIDHAQAVDYANAPDAYRIIPAASYKWATVGVSSPVLPFRGIDRIEKTLRRVCAVLRNNLRIHKPLVSIPTTTSIFIGHTRGFTLLELKKFVTLMMFTSSDLARLHPEERASSSTATAGKHWLRPYCGSFLRLSALASASCGDAHLLSNEQHAYFPHPSDPVRRVLTEQMEHHMPADEIFKACDKPRRVFLRAVWLFESVDHFAKSLGPFHPGEKLDVMIRCSGEQRRTQPRPATKDDLDPLPFEHVDTQRGVIEFRHMMGSTDPRHIVSWAAVAGQLVRISRETSADEFHQILLRFMNAHEPVFDILDLPERLQTVFYSRTPNDFWQPPPVEFDQPFEERLQ